LTVFDCHGLDHDRASSICSARSDVTMGLWKSLSSTAVERSPRYTSPLGRAAPPKENVMKRRLLFLGLVLSSTSLLTGELSWAQSKKIERRAVLAPLPAAISQAKRVFLLNGQTTSQYLTKNGNALAFDTLYADIKGWGRYELVDSPKAADIVIELQYRPYSQGSSSFGVYNPSSKTVQAHSADASGADFALVIYEAASKDELWSVSDACGFARFVANQRKEVVKSIDRLVENLRSRAQPTG
jgi:hypothetical protein